MGARELALEWDRSDPDTWSGLLVRARRSNLLQSWAYGEAKAATEGWRVRRGVIVGGEEPVACLQALEKAWGPFAGVVRINRGPLFLTVGPEARLRRAVYRCIRRAWPFSSRRLLLIAPEIEADEAALLADLCFCRRGSRGWCSVWIDLDISDDTLRANLKGNWRNQLKAAERAGLAFAVSDGEHAFDWLMARHREAMIEKGFSGPSPDLLSRFRAEAPDSLPVMTATAGGERVGAILVARHGIACTYVVGWNGPEGRRLRAHNFLVFHSLAEMRRRGCAWFDLGGIDDAATPGVATFKRGLGGAEYRLAGEFWGIGGG